jgi:23S rRNA (uracil1939-C5)-methyltransferase
VSFAEDRALAGLFVQSGRKHTLSALSGPETPPVLFHLEASGRPLSLEMPPGGFAQANWAVNQTLVDELAGLSHLYGGRPALDVFSGSGNFTLPLALQASSVAAVEGYPPAAACGERNALRNGFGNVRALSLPAAEGLRVLAEEGFRPRFAVLDPPREGAREALQPLAALAPDHVLYISCSPPTLARDLGLLAGFGYRVQWTRMADMFPQTAHMESMTLLARCAGSAKGPSATARKCG